jgi:preprotein translocase subunit SecD
MKNLPLKLSVIGIVTALAVWAFTPPSQKIRLGLDLQGGVHLVLAVKTDDAVRLETETVSEQVKQALKDKGITVTTKPGAKEFAVEGVARESDQQFRAITDPLVSASFNRDPGPNGSYTFRMKPNVEVTTRAESVTQAILTIEKRVNELGVSEPTIAPYGSAGDQIIVQLPGLKDVARAKDIIKSTAVLEIKLVIAGPMSDETTLLQPYGGQVPADMQVVQGTEGTGASVTRTFYLVRKVAAVTGRDLRNARATLDEYNQPAVSFTLNPEGVSKFSVVTRENIGKLLAIVLDNQVQSAPVIETAIPSAEARITGRFTQQEVTDLALVLRSGALPARLDYLEQRQVGPTLGADSIRSGIMASLTGPRAGDDLHVPVLPAVGVQRVRVGCPEPRDSAWCDGLCRRGDDPSGHRRVHPDDRHGCGLERADFRAHPRGTGEQEERAPGRCGRVWPRVLDHRRYARRVTHRRGVSVSVRYRPHSRLCHDAGLRAVVQRVHGRLCLAHAL